LCDRMFMWVEPVVPYRWFGSVSDRVFGSDARWRFGW